MTVDEIARFVGSLVVGAALITAGVLAVSWLLVQAGRLVLWLF